MNRHVLLKLFATVGMLLAIMLPGAVPAFAARSNDDFDDALVIRSLPFTDTQDLSQATAAPDDPTRCSSAPHSVWYAFTPDETMYINLRADIRFSTLSVYTGARGSLTQLECYGNFPVFRMQVTAGQTYFFLVQHAFAQAVTFSLSRSVLPPNDDFDDAITIPALPFSTDDEYGLAFSSPDDPSCFVKTLWYKFTPTREMWIEGAVSSQRAPFGRWSIYTGTRGNLSEIVCGPTYYPPPIVHLQANTTYYFMFGLNADTGLNYSYQSINLREVSPPVTIDATLDTKGTVDPKTGAVTLEGTFGCSRATTGGVSIQLDQALGQNQASGSQFVFLRCDVTATTWSATIPAVDGAFNPGPLNATLRFIAFNENRRDPTVVTLSDTVYLRAAPSK